VTRGVLPVMKGSAMSFDPNLPVENSLIDAVELRAQFNGLKALMDAIPAVTGAQIDAVNTLPAGEEATVTVAVDGGTLRFTFGIPQGENGGEGAPGEVTAAQLAEAIATRASSVAGVSQLEMTPDAEYNPGQIQELAGKYNELLQALQSEA